MSDWLAWTKLASGIYQGAPRLRWSDPRRRLLSCAAMGSNGNLWEIDEQSPNQWGEPAALGGKGAVVHAPIAPHRRPLIVNGANNALYAYMKNRRWGQTGANGRFQHEIVQASDPQGNLHYAGIGLNGGVWLGQNNNGHWNWEALQGLQANGRPSLVFSHTGSHLFARGIDGDLWHIHQVNGRWLSWQKLGQSIKSPPVAVARQHTRHIECYARGYDDALWWMVWNGAGWSGFQRLGGGFKGTPAVAASLVADKTYVFVRGGEVGNTRLWYNFRIGGIWGGWQKDEQGIIGSDPDLRVTAVGNGERALCVMLGKGNQDIWARGYMATG